MSETVAEATLSELVAEVARLREEVAAAQGLARRAADRGEIENLFNRYMHLHNAFQDERIIPLWVKDGTEGIRARYTNAGQYTTWESVTRYHRGRPSPEGKLILHATTTPVIEVAGDGRTAKGVWIMAGTESGLTDPEVAKGSPDFMYSPGEVQGKKVWAHWVWCKYAIDFLRQDGEWRIWKFRCYELARAPFEENWVSFGEKNQAAFDLDLMYFGDDGKPVFMPPADEPVPSENHPYSPSTVQKLEPEPPAPHDTFADTFK
ncbi:nuclear transport factor 2 family protein [Leifsonia sp. L25]|uniref:nuclear transport factor 2 family protein n=1 Tax=Actinomycetes TaxID=1760 RepID=UPI003D695C7C